MTISFKWLSEYLVQPVDPERLGRILTSIGLEVDSMTKYEEVKGGLKGLVTGEILSTEKHPNADKLTLTRVDIGGTEPLQIVCGAPNVAKGQKVIVAPVGVTIYPFAGDPITIKLAKIRSVESYGMICAEDEVGLGNAHTGILVLPAEIKVGLPVSEWFQPYEDIIYEIGLTPNRMDAMSHWGVARDVSAYLCHHDKNDQKPKFPISNGVKAENHSLEISVTIENEKACPRYSGISISDIKINESPHWLKQRLKSIGLRPINNIVDITNYIQQETGQPLHAFDADKIRGGKVIVKNLPQATKFMTLDEKERELNAEDLMICDAEGPLCMAGVFGGSYSGVTNDTKNIFIESACFDAVSTRKTSFRHGLRTDAASRFEKGTDISATVNVLKRTVLLIKEIAGGSIASDLVDVYPTPLPKKEVSIKWHYIKKLSGKNYHPDAVTNILGSLGFEVLKNAVDELRISVPHHKPDISLPADIVEEILRIDGLDNIDIPDAITVTPSVEENHGREVYKEKLSGVLTGLGFNEMLTNSITNAAYFSEEEKAGMVNMLNSLSAELNILRSSLFETALEIVAHNLNHKNGSLRLFEFGKGYGQPAPGEYRETEQLCIVTTGNKNEDTWKGQASQTDLYFLKGVVNNLLALMGVKNIHMEELEVPKLEQYLIYKLSNGTILGGIGSAKRSFLQRFGIRQPVYFALIDWEKLLMIATTQRMVVQALPKFPAVQRDLAMLVSKKLKWQQVESVVHQMKLKKLLELRLFDVFESEKLGEDRKSIAINFTFQDTEKTLTDKEIDDWMQSIMKTLEKELQAEIRK